MTDQELLHKIYSGMQSMSQEIQSMHSDMQSMNQEIQSIRSEMQSMNQEIQSIRSDMQSMSQEIQSLNARVDRLEERVSNLEMTLENETNRNIRIIAEGHLDVMRKLDDALEVTNEKEILLLRVNHLENEIQRIKKVISLT